MAKQIENVLVILDYLLHFTDENHKSSEKGIVIYAKDTYNLDIDHRSICDAFNKIQHYFDSYPDKFPFILENDGGVRKKYYIEQKAFNDNEIIAIASAIKNDQFTYEELANDLIDKFIDSEVTSKDKAIELKKVINNQTGAANKIDKKLAKKIEKISSAIVNKCRVKYTLEFAKNNKDIRTDYFYKVIYLNSIPYAIAIHDGKLVSYRVSQIKILEVEESWYSDPHSKFNIADLYHGQFAKADDEIKTSKLPNAAGEIVTCEFNFKNEDYSIDMVTKTYKSFFNQELDYKIIDNRCYSKVKCELYTFLRWCTSYDVALLVSITGNQILLKNYELFLNKILHNNGLDKLKITWFDNNKNK